MMNSLRLAIVVVHLRNNLEEDYYQSYRDSMYIWFYLDEDANKGLDMMSNYDIEGEDEIMLGLIADEAVCSEVLEEWRLRLVESLLMAWCSRPF